MQNHIQCVKESLWQQLNSLTLPVCRLVLPLWFLRAASLTATRELIGFGKLRPSESLGKIDVRESRLEILATQPRLQGWLNKAHTLSSANNTVSMSIIQYRVRHLTSSSSLFLLLLLLLPTSTPLSSWSSCSTCSHAGQSVV